MSLSMRTDTYRPGVPSVSTTDYIIQCTSVIQNSLCYPHLVVYYIHKSQYDQEEAIYNRERHAAQQRGIYYATVRHSTQWRTFQ